MLFQQSSSAAEGSLAGYFSRDPTISAQLSTWGHENRVLSASVDADELLPLEGMERLLSINKYLRRLYDSTASRHLQSFDDATAPLMGWKSFLKS